MNCRIKHPLTLNLPVPIFCYQVSQYPRDNDFLARTKSGLAPEQRMQKYASSCDFIVLDKLEPWFISARTLKITKKVTKNQNFENFMFFVIFFAILQS